ARALSQARLRRWRGLRRLRAKRIQPIPTSSPRLARESLTPLNPRRRCRGMPTVAFCELDRRSGRQGPCTSVVVPYPHRGCCPFQLHTGVGDWFVVARRDRTRNGIGGNFLAHEDKFSCYDTHTSLSEVPRHSTLFSFSISGAGRSRNRIARARSASDYRK